MSRGQEEVKKYYYQVLCVAAVQSSSYGLSGTDRRKGQNSHIYCLKKISRNGRS